MDLLSKFKGISLFRRGTKYVVGLDIGTSAIKVIELSERGGKTRLVNYGTLSLGPYTKSGVGSVARLPQEKIIEAVNTAFKAIEVKAKHGALAIPLKLSLIVTIEVPQSAEDKLDKVVPYEARKYIPVPPQEANIAWSLVSAGDERSMDKEQNKKEIAAKIKVLVAAIHNTTIENYKEIAEKVGLVPAILEIETFSAMRAVLSDDQGTIALVDIGSDASKVVLYDFGSITVSHTIRTGSQAFTHSLIEALGVSFSDAEKIKRREGLAGSHEGRELAPILDIHVQNIFTEAKKIIEDFEHEQKRKIEKVILIGGGSLISGIVPKGKEIIGKEVVHGDPFSRIELPTPLLAKKLQETGPEFAISIGLALRALEEL